MEKWSQAAACNLCKISFCGETEEEHEDTSSLTRAVVYDMADMFAYSMREKTRANRNCSDDVPEGVKQRRLTELIEAFSESTGRCYDSQSVQLVLVEGSNKRAPGTELIGESDRGHRVSFVNVPVPQRDRDSNGARKPVVDDYVEVRITESTRASLFGEALAVTKLSSFSMLCMKKLLPVEAVVESIHLSSFALLNRNYCKASLF